MEQKGEKIEGSKFYRSFCKRCGEPMRVTKNRINDAWCEVCSPPQVGVGSPRSSPITSDERSSTGGYA